MKALIGCEYSGIVRDAFRSRGVDAISCDLLETDTPGPHYKGDIMDIINDGWDLMIVFPPCTYLCSSGLFWNKTRPERQQKTEESLKFVRSLLNADIPHIALENPIGCIGTRIRKPDQIIHPYEYGHNASKSTCLWLKNLPNLTPTKIVPPERYYNGLPRWGNQSNCGADSTPPGPDRWKIRSTTYQGIAEAMADQWIPFIESGFKTSLF